ncbi:acyl-ACP thioesterase [Desulfosporosinus sp. HMP52]|uniref:acyl-[acyl-carrier-protein] thioesterase n=1 Tax=Desulfosporosinus sp. HMP52 TaxID=1487923 RepID=UPI00051FAB5E|nr:acyl-ACP thioesterase domain-containing protein [Desulfosporosinus sp. HMP52]KGK87081.1 acyl-ACP thioesterase [Desulfosporosinus sp. HMP52]
MINQRFNMEFEVYYHEVNPKEQATPLAILHYLEDAAISHSESIGQGIKQLQAKKQAWILNQWILQMNRYPVLGEKVMIETWSSGFERFYANRDFLIKDKNQEIIGKATSLWIFYNTESKRPSRIPQGFQEAYGVDPIRVIEDATNQFQIHEVGDQAQAVDNEQIFTVRRSDIDTNGHVNNANYLQWMLEVIPEDVYQNAYLAAMKITYRKAATYGSSIRSKCHEAESKANKPMYQHVILENGDLQELATALTVWKSV